MVRKAAVILSGCGHQDGAEIRESVLCLTELDKNDIDFDIFAPDIQQTEVRNHTTHSPVNETRNVMIEAARIARGKISPLSELNPKAYDALVLPGGFGVAKNLSDVADKGAEGHVIPQLDSIIKAFHSNSKPIAAVCIAPAVVAISLKSYKPKLTLGNESNLLTAIGVPDTKCDTNKFVYDEQNKLLSTPAYMHDDRISMVSEGIGMMIKKLKEII